MSLKILSAVGLLVFILIAWLLSQNRKQNPLRVILSGVGLQFFFALVVLKTEAGLLFFDLARRGITRIISFSDKGAEMVFGESFRDHFYAFSVSSTIVFVSSMMAVLFHLGIMQKIVHAMAWVMVKVMGISGAEALSASANVFVGQTEAPLVVKPYIDTMTRSELLTLMVGGMATIAGGVMAAYVSFGADPGHLLAASIMSAPAAILVAKLMIPETETPKTLGRVKIDISSKDCNVLDAACRGATEGLNLALNVAAMLLTFVAFAFLLNALLEFFPTLHGEPLTIERILSWIFMPVAFLLGIPSQDIPHVASLLGKKMFFNEFFAYLDLKELKGVISERSFILSTYALCGFANFSSIAIQIGGVGNLVPARRKDLAELGIKSMLGGTLAALMTAAIAGILL